MSSKRLNRTDVGIKRMVLSRIGTNLNHAGATVILNKAIAWIAEIVLGLPKVIMTRLKMTVVTALAIALVVMSFPIEASAVGAAPLDVSGIGTLNSGNVTFQGELELGAVFTSLIPGPGGNWHFSLSGDCVWKVNPAVTIAGRGYVVGSLPLLNSDTGHIRLSLDRLFLQHELSRVRAIIGKQAINWGVASVFRPTDLITPRGSDMSGKGRQGKVLGSLFFRTPPPPPGGGVVVGGGVGGGGGGGGGKRKKKKGGGGRGGGGGGGGKKRGGGGGGARGGGGGPPQPGGGGGERGGKRGGGGGGPHGGRHSSAEPKYNISRYTQCNIGNLRHYRLENRASRRRLSLCRVLPQPCQPGSHRHRNTTRSCRNNTSV